MKEPKNMKRGGETISLAALTKVRPVPFGDVRKYYLAAKVGTVVLLALCFHVSVAAIALRTDSCEQLSTALIVMILLSAIAVIVGHYMRSLLGYGISAAAAFLLILLLQFGNGGAPVSLVSDLPEYGEVFRDGAKSTEFWILLAKVIAVVHLLLTVLFIRSTLTVTEEPPLKGMNVTIQKVRDWIKNKKNSYEKGRSPIDYWIFAISVFLWMLFISFNPDLTMYDFYSMGLLLAAGILLIFKQTLLELFCLVVSALIRCSLYQLRFGFIRPTIASYTGLWLALFFLILEGLELRRANDAKSGEWSERISTVLSVIAVAFFVLLTPVHEFLSVFSGSYMIYQKDNLPLIFFIPIVIFLMMSTGKWYSYFISGALYWWLWNSLSRASPYADLQLFRFDSMPEHGTIGADTTRRMMNLVKFISGAAIALIVISVGAGILLIILRRLSHENKKTMVD